MITLANSALIDIDKMLTEDIYYWHGMAKANLWTLLDHIDIHTEVPSVDYEKLSGDRMGEWSGTIRTRVQTARDT